MFQISKIMSHCYSTVSCNNGKMGYYYFIAFFSLLFHRYLSLRQLYLISSLSVTLYLFPLLPAQESCSRSLSRKLPLISLVLAADLAALCSSFGWFGGFWVCDWVEVVGCGRIMDCVWDWVLIWIEVLGWVLMAWFRWEVSHGDCAVFVVAVERWKRKVGGGWIVVFFFFFAGVGGYRLRSGGRGRLLGLGLCFFFFFLLPPTIVCGCGWWGNGGSGCCDGLVFFFFFFSLFCWGFWIWNLLVLLVLLIGVDVVAVVDDNGEEIIYYFNV